MVAIANRVTTLFDFKESGGGLKKIRSDIAAADTATGKFKAGWAGAMSTVKQYGAEAALAVGTTLVAGAVKAGQEFANAAIAAGQFADATGLSTEQASQWISVADDLGLNANDVQKAFLRLNKEIGEGGGVAEEYGLTLKRTADGAADVNGTMLETIATINKIKDPTERARVAQELFGRSYANVAELIFDDAEKVRAALESTSDAQIFDEDEVRRAREYREAMDRLGDVLVDLKFEVGSGVVPVMSDLANVLADVDGAVRTLSGNSTGLGGAISSTLSSIILGNPYMRAAAESLWNQADAAEEASKWIEETAHQAVALAESHNDVNVKVKDGVEITSDYTQAQVAVETAIRQARYEVEHSNKALDRAREFAKRAAEFVANLGTKWDILKGKLSDRAAFLDVEDAFDNVKSAAEEAWTAAAEGSEDAEQKARDYERAQIDLKNRVIDYGTEVNELPDEVLTNILSLIDQGKLAEAEAALARLERARIINYVPVVQAPRTAGGQRFMASGGRSEGGITRVGERGPEDVWLPRGAEVRSATQTITDSRNAGGASRPAVVAAPTFNITVHAGMGADGADVGRKIVEEIRRFERFNGSGWRS